MKERKRILDIIDKSRGYDIAIFTTFNFDVTFFESEILAKLNNNSIKKVSLFVDERQFDETLKNKNIFDSRLGSSYNVSRVLMNGAFHPKISLFLGEKKAKLIVTSANITRSGYYNNNEIFNVIEYDESKPEYLGCIKSAIDFVVDVNKQSDGFDNKLINEITELPYYHETEQDDERIILNNINQSMIDQINDIVNDEIEEILIATPYYDEKVIALGKIKEVFPTAKLSLFIQQEKSTFPVKYQNDYIIRVFESLRKNDANNTDSGKKEKDDSEDEIKNYLTNFYHGKVFLFITKNSEYVLYGSPNCTQSALTKSFLQGGNIECAILDKGTKGEFEEFFDNFVICENTELKESPFISETKAKDNKNFRLIKATKKGPKTICEIKKLSEDKDFRIEYSGKELKYELDGDNIIVSVYDAENIFDLTFVVNGKEELLRCWTIDSDSIRYYRMSEDEKKFVPKESLELYDDEGFIEFSKQLLMLEREAQRKYEKMCKRKEELNEEKKSLEYGDEIDIDIEKETNELKKEELSYEKDREKLIESKNLFFNFKIHSKSELKKLYNKGNNVNTERKTPDVPIDIREGYIGFVRDHINKTIKAEIENIDGESFYKMVTCFEGILKREYSINNQQESLFDNEGIVSSMCELLNKLMKRLGDTELKKEISEETIHHSKELIIAEILENHAFTKTINDDAKRVDLESENKMLLHRLDNLYSIRKDIDGYLEGFFKIQEDDTHRYEVFKYYDKDSAKAYIDGLFDYKTEKDLMVFIEKIISNVQISREGATLYVKFSTEKIINNLKPDELLIKEIKETARKEKSFKKVIIDVGNLRPIGDNPIVRIKHKVSLELFSGRNWDCSIYYKDGTVEEKKPQRLSSDYS